MLVFLYIIFIIILGLLISLIMPDFLSDMNTGFYFAVLGTFSLSALIIMLRKRTSFFKILSDYIAIVLSVAILAEGALIYFSANDAPKATEQAIIVAGSGLFVESRLTAELEKKLDKALEIYMENADLPIILSGGTDENRTLPQCVAMKSYLEKQVAKAEISMPKVIMEDSSSGIFENIKNSLEISGVSSAYIIVSRHSVARTKLIANRISPDSTVIGAEYPLSKYIIYYIRELGLSLKTIVSDGVF